jgi:hypothetical protein
MERHAFRYAYVLAIGLAGGIIGTTLSNHLPA